MLGYDKNVNLGGRINITTTQMPDKTIKATVVATKQACVIATCNADYVCLQRAGVQEALDEINGVKSVPASSVEKP